MSKRRVTITVDEDLFDEVADTVETEEGVSLSAWINQAVIERLARDRRLAVLAALIEEHEATQGVITEDEMAEQAQIDRDAAAASRSRPRRTG